MQNWTFAMGISEVPVAITVLRGETYRAPRNWAERSFEQLTYWTVVDKGGTFAAHDEPQLITKESRAAVLPPSNA